MFGTSSGLVVSARRHGIYQLAFGAGARHLTRACVHTTVHGFKHSQQSFRIQTLETIIFQIQTLQTIVFDSRNNGFTDPFSFPFPLNFGTSAMPPSNTGSIEACNQARAPQNAACCNAEQHVHQQTPHVAPHVASRVANRNGADTLKKTQARKTTVNRNVSVNKTRKMESTIRVSQ
jgi:hypothetical protein